MKARIRQNRWSNWYGYLGSKRVEAFGNSSTETAEQAANRWLREQQRESAKELCWVTREKFLEYVGVVNAEVELRGKHTVIYRTKYAQVAERIERLAKTANARTISSTTDEGLRVVKVARLYDGRGRRL